MQSTKTIVSTVNLSSNLLDTSNSKILIPKSKWIADEKATSCFNCNADFIFFIKRRHHCRMCGQVFCSKCSNYFFEPSLLGISHEENSIRFCEYCYKIVAKIIGLNSKLDNKEPNPTFSDESQDLSGLSHNIFQDYPESNEEILLEPNIMQGVMQKIEKITEFQFKRYNLYEKYYNPLVDKIKRAATELIINTLVYEDPMNINEYVKIKKIVYPDESECKYISGIVCTKNISHRKMKGNIREPKMLIISPSLEIPHCKRESLTYFQDLDENEEKFIKQSIANIIKINPNIILVEQSINGKIQNYLYSHEILYVQKIKSKLLKRIARATQGKIFEDIVKLNKSNANLGKCKNFYVRTFYEGGATRNDAKGLDLMYIDGCKEGYGATITISGPELNELLILKKCMKQILVIARHLHLEKELVSLDKSYEIYKLNGHSKGVNTQGDFRSFLDEKIPMKELIDQTKIICMKLNLVEVPAEYFHDLASLNERFIENIHTFIQNNKSKFKVPFLAVMCGNPVKKCHEFYSDEGAGEENPQDTTLGNYIKLRVNSLFTRCTACKRPRYRHVTVYYYRNTYLKVTAELMGVTKALALRKEEDTLRQNNFLIIEKSPAEKVSGKINEWKSSLDSLKEEIIPNTKSPQNNTISPKNSSASALNNIGNKLVSIFSKGSLDQFSNSNGPFSRETNKRTIIQTYIECRNCNEKLTRVQDLRILYLEYSFSEFLRHYFINEFSKDVNWEEFERNFEKNECPHYRKSRVFKLDEFLVKFYGGENRLYSIKKVNLLDKSVQEELALMNHKICIEKATELLDKISVIIEFLKKDIVDKKSFIRKPKPRSINLASVNPDNLVSPLKKKDLVHLISELDGIYKSLETHYADLKLRMDKVENYLEIEKNRIRSFYFFIGIVQRLSFMEEMIPKETKEDDNEGFTLRNLKRIFKFKQDLMSPSLNSNISKPTKSNINNNNNNQSDELARNSDFEDHILLKSNMEFSKSRFLKKTRFNTKVPPSKSRGHSKSDSCPNFNFIIKQFPLFLSEDDIKIPSKVVLSSLSKEKNNLPLVRNLSVFNKESKLIKIKEIKPDLFKKMKSYDIDVITTKVPVAKSTLLSNNDNKECNSTIKLKSELFSPEEPLENQNLNDEIVESSHNLKEEKEKVQIVLANCSLTRENGSEEGMEEDNNDEKANEDRSSSEHDEIYKNFNPNNLPKSKKYRMRSSGSIMIETQEWYILTDLLKGLCEAEQENEFKATKFYKFIPIMKTQPLSVIAYALNSTKYLKEIYIKEGFYEHQKFIKSHAEVAIVQEHLTNFMKMKLYFNETVERNDEFILHTNILEMRKGKFFYRNSSHNLEKLLQEEEQKMKVQKCTSYVSSFEESDDILSYLLPSSKIKILIYYPRQFEALRMSQDILLRDFIKSLALSNSWSDNTGGKSNASFIKTYDNLYVFKNLRNNEFKMFKAYAIQFFKFMFKVGFEKRKKSFLARIYGMFEVHIDSEKYYYVAMENLFFGLDPTTDLKIYDLKGSETNRYISNSKEKQVLFDTNFKIDQNGEPLSLKDNEKENLMQGIENDTKFLSKHNLIDYSLLLIIDRKNSLIRLGIIDYLRLFTWDKQVESIGKKMIKAGATPTIINAADYRKRFQEAMNKYFMGIQE